MSFFRKTKYRERMIRFRRLPPVGTSAEETIPVSDLFRRDALFLCHIWGDRELPPLEETNRILLRGLGDDGFIGHIWEPFELSAKEHKELNRQIRAEGPERFVQHERSD